MCRRLHTSSTDLTRSPGDLWVTIRRHSRKGYSYRTSRDRHKYANYPRAPSSRRSGLVGPYTTPPIVNYKYMTSTRREGYFCAAHARDVNIFIWTSRKSVGHETNDRVMIHGDGTRTDGRRSRYEVRLGEIVGSGDRRPAPSIFGSRSNVVHNQAG